MNMKTLKMMTLTAQTVSMMTPVHGAVVVVKVTTMGHRAAIVTEQVLSHEKGTVMKSDKELLELAAKAADYGFIYKRKISNDAHEWTSDDGMLWQWNPLMDDGQAMRLAVKLWIVPEVHKPDNDVIAHIDADIYPNTRISPREHLWSDPYAATRRAIVRAAAEIGETL